MPLKDISFPAIRFLLNFLLAIAIASTVAFVLFQFFLPTASEYDDPTTEIQESFPWEPDIFKNGAGAWHIFKRAVVRHWATLPEHMTATVLITGIGLAFATLLIYDMRETFVVRRDPIELSHFVKWGICSVIAAIIYVAGKTSIHKAPEVTLLVIGLSLGAFILYAIRAGILKKSEVKNIAKRRRNKKRGNLAKKPQPASS